MKNSYPLSLFGSFIFLLLSTFSHAQTQTVFVDDIPGTNSWRVPCDVTSIKVEVWGAGGRGGTATSTSNNTVAGGGAGGAYASKTITVIPGNTLNYEVGKGGGPTDPNGSDTWFLNQTTLLAKGGPGVANNGTAGAIAPAASESIGNTRFKGGNGANAVTGTAIQGGGGGSSAGTSLDGTAVAGNNGNGSAGGTAPTGNGGAGGNGATSNAAGSPGNSPGGGGGGSHSEGTDRPGGTGGNGKIRITYTSSYKTNYCTKAFTLQVEPITQVKFAGIDNVSSATISPAQPAHEYFCNQATVKRGNSYPIAIKGNTNGTYENYVRVYIDWNQDGIYQDTEKYDLGILANSNGTDAVVLNSFISVPTTAFVGPTKMRVLKNRIGTGNDYTDACTGAFRGQAEEYTVSVLAADACRIPHIATASNITHTSAILNWVARYNTTAMSYDVQWSTNSTFNPSTTVTVAAGVFKHPITGLTSGTTYYYRVRANCSGSAQSSWSASESFVTGRYSPIELTGFNADVIANGTSGTGGSTTNAAVDVTSFAFVEKNSFINDITMNLGMPENRVIKNSDGNETPTEVKYLMKNYSGNNSLRLSNNTAQKLTLEKPRAYSAMYVAATAGDLSSNVTIEVIYNDELGNNPTFHRTVADWFEVTPTHIYRAGSRVSVTDQIPPPVITGFPRIFQLKLEGLDANRKVKEIKFTRTSTGNERIANIFAVSGNDCAEVVVARTEPVDCSQDYTLFSVSSEDTSYTYTWAPAAGLYTNAALTTPYVAGTSATQVYASPEGTQTYTLTATSVNGCVPKPTFVVAERFNKTWNGTNSQWTTAANWSGNTIPNANHCVKINTATHSPVISTGTIAFAKTVSVATGGKLTIQKDASLTVTDFVKNGNGDDNVANFIIKSGGSLVQLNNTAANSGSITAERDFKFSAARQQYNYVISPVVGQTIKNIYTGAPFVIKYVEGQNWFVNAGVGPYVPAKGYAIKEATGNGVATVTGVFKGVPANGLMSYPLQYGTANTQTGDQYNGYNLVGNPYPSALDLTKLYADNSTKIEATFLFWDNRDNPWIEQQGSNYDGTNYATFNAASTTGNAAPRFAANEGLARIPNKFVAPATSFLTRALSNGNPLDFNNAQRSASTTATEFFGKNDDGSKNTSRYWLTLRTPAGMEYMTAVVYHWNGDNAFSADDSEVQGTSDEIYTLANNEQVIIQGRAPFVKSDKVPLGVRLFDMGTYVISLYDKEGVFANGQNIYIRDKKLKTTYNLTQADYKFIEGAGEINDRFELIYNPNSLTAQNAASENASEISIEKKDKNIVVTSTSDKITQIEVYSLTGRSVFKKTGINNLEFKLPVSQFEKQIIVIHVETETGEVITKKFVNK